MSETTVPPYPPCPFRDSAEGRWHLIRVVPEEPLTRDPFEPLDPVHGWWAAYEALDGRAQKPLAAVWRRWSEFPLDENPATLLVDVLWHPETPFGLGLKPRWLHPGYTNDGRRWRMFVAFRGDFFLRTDDGVLHPTGKRIEWWPTAEDYWAGVRHALTEGEA